MSYLYGLTKAYDITKARRRSKYFADESERDLWEVNERLKREIDRCSYSGWTWACVDISLKNGESANQVTASDLASMYSEAGYKTRIMPLYNGYGELQKAFRLIVEWEE